MSASIVAPGVQGKFRRRSSAAEWLLSHFDKMAAAGNTTPQPWPNSADSYELKEIIGKKNI